MKLRKFIANTILECINENNQNELKISDLFDKSFQIKLGSGIRSRIDGWDKESLIEIVKDIIKHNLFDYDFYYNWTDLSREYSDIFNETVLMPMMNNLDETFSKYFSFKRVSASSRDVLDFDPKMDTQLWIDNWFQTNKNIPEELRKDYYHYRKKYAGVSLD